MVDMTPTATDDKGRPIADDGYPVSGLATVEEASAVLALSKSQIYAMIATKQLASKSFGRAKRVLWSSIRDLLAE